MSTEEVKAQAEIDRQSNVLETEALRLLGMQAQFEMRFGYAPKPPELPVMQNATRAD
jgi:hypothetical protein